MSSIADEAKGLAYVLAECGDFIPEEEFNDWYTNEHAPARLALPGFLTAARYKAIDSVQPKWLTLYDLSSPEVGNSAEYEAMTAAGSEREVRMMQNIGFLNRRVYERIGIFTHESLGTSIPQITLDNASEGNPSIYPKYVFSVSMSVTPEGEQDFNKWYDEEHMPLLSKIPGWHGGRRYKIVSSVERGNWDSLHTKDNSLFPTTPSRSALKYLALHALSVEASTFMNSKEWIEAQKETEWRARVVKGIIARDYRVFELSQSFN
ncbi:hypothetical protein C8J56DRAFT_988705 [Mycena floridula]|nr:hypothetical protein C8J56DRAFT_988705 [Mycena floridula]